MDLLLEYGVQNIDIRDVEGRTPLQMAVRCGNAQAVKKLVDHGADVSVVQADETDARRLKRLKNEAKMMEQHLKVEMGSAQKGNETKQTTGVASVQGAEKLTESHPKLEKILRQSPSSTYTTKEIEEEAEAKDTGSESRQIKGESSRTNKCVLA